MSYNVEIMRFSRTKQDPNAGIIAGIPYLVNMHCWKLALALLGADIVGHTWLPSYLLH